MRKNDIINDSAKYGDLYSIPRSLALPLSPSMIGINHCDPAYYNERPAAKLSVLGHVIDGHGTVQAGTAAWHVSAGDTFVLPKYAHHRVYPESEAPERWSYYWINVEDDFFLELLKQCGLGNGGAAAGREMRSLFERGFRLAAAGNDNLQAVQTEMASILFELTYRFGAAALALRHTLTPLVLAAKDYLDRNLEERVTLDDLCRFAGCTVRQINYRFKRELGLTPYQYVLRQKLSAARRLLEQTDLPLRDIADKLAFPDMYYFSNLFKQKIGASPSQYRRNAHRK